MTVGNTRLDREFRGDSKHPNRRLTVTQCSCQECGDGRVVYDSERGESRCQSCDAPPWNRSHAHNT